MLEPSVASQGEQQAQQRSQVHVYTQQTHSCGYCSPVFLSVNQSFTSELTISLEKTEKRHCFLKIGSDRYYGVNQKWDTEGC